VVRNREAGELAVIDELATKAIFHALWLQTKMRTGKRTPIPGN
jgi:hypothetical protein